MELKDLNFLIAIYEEKSISRAAERLYMAQSSLSQFLSNYERALGYRIFVRTAANASSASQKPRPAPSAVRMLSPRERASAALFTASPSTALLSAMTGK